MAYLSMKEWVAICILERVFAWWKKIKRDSEDGFGDKTDSHVMS